MSNKFGGKVTVFSDYNIEMDPQNEFVKNEFSLDQAIENLNGTDIGERHFLPDYGIPAREQVFELMNPATEFQVINSYIRAINRWDDRLQINRFQSGIESIDDDHMYKVLLNFYAPKLGESFVYKGEVNS